MSNGGNVAIIVDEVHYQSTQTLTNRTLMIINEWVEPLVPENSTEAITDFMGLDYLIQAIHDREPLKDVDVIVHKGASSHADNVQPPIDAPISTATTDDSDCHR